MTVFKWSTTAATNDDIDGSINWQEGQSPASVNNSARAMMAAIAKWNADMSGNLLTAGSSTAYTVTTNQGFTALTDGIWFSARIHTGNGSSPTINVDGLGAKSIATALGNVVGAGKLRTGAVHVFVYDSSDDKWIVRNNPDIGFEAGTKILFRQTAAPTGWTKDTTYTDAALRVTSGSISQRVTAGREFSTIFAARTISEANLPAHTHTFSGTTSSNGTKDTSIFYDMGAVGGSTGTRINALSTTDLGEGGQTFTTANNHTHTYSGTTSSVGSGAALDFIVDYVDCIIATRD